MDEETPQFSDSKYGSFDGDSKYQGKVFLGVEQFYGSSPYSVPFTGYAYGDIKDIYVDGRKVNFNLGEEIFFKRRIYLDGGYNRVPVKIIDKKGNITKSYIPITIESMSRNEINIDNDINIEE